MSNFPIKGLKKGYVIAGWGTLFLAIVLTLVPVNDPNQVTDGGGSASPEKYQRDTREPLGGNGPSAEAKTGHTQNKQKANGPQSLLPKPDFSSIESILKDPSASFEDKATDLLECARQEDLPMEVRLAALDHAFNLDRWQALTLCMEKPLQTPIAGRLLSAVHNLNESPKDQVSAGLHLMEHEDEEISQRAQRLVAFLVSTEEHSADPDKLREKANAFLKQTHLGGEEDNGQ